MSGHSYTKSNRKIYLLSLLICIYNIQLNLENFRGKITVYFNNSSEKQD